MQGGMTHTLSFSHEILDYQGLSAVRNVLSSCDKRRGTQDPPCHQKMADLPSSRLDAPLPNREYLAPQIRSMNNRFHSEAKLPWSYDYPLANHMATNKSSANREVPLFSRLYPSFGYLRKIFPPRVLKYSLFSYPEVDYFRQGCEDINQYGLLFTCVSSRAIHLRLTWTHSSTC